ncbi:MAG TPA: thiol reductant ABC exporter subunit CydC [Stellaceae bacterium]|jgi:ATP-binding cassette subfamily C protein CydCD|nr:thiol reductant ABC exporter subunit CydC [Stellaceae bacterium]
MYFDRRLWELTRGLRGRISLAIFLGLCGSACGIARVALLGVLLARVFVGAGVGTITALAIGVGVAVLLRAAFDHARTVIAHQNAGRVQQELRRRLYDKIAELGPAWFAGERTGGVMLSVVDGVEQLQSFFGQYLPQVAISALTPLAIFFFIVWWDAPVATVMLVFALATLIAPTAFHRLESGTGRVRQQAMKGFGSEFLDAVQGLPTLKAFGQSTAYGKRLAERARYLSDTTMKVLSTSVMTRGITDAGIAIGAAAALALGVWRVSHGEMTIEALLIVLMAGTEVFRPLRDLRAVLHQGMVGQSAAAGIHALLESEPLIPPTVATRAVPALSPTIAFEDVHFAYPGGRQAAHDGLSFAVAAGEKIGIVGSSGSGKSSVARLLLRLFDPQSGAVKVGGQDLRMLDPDVLRREIAVVHQDTYLFHGTVEENLRLGKPEATQAEIETAARDANAHDFIEQLPQGYKTLLGERGVNLSGGQRQRLAIARALLRDSPILILDEALSSVDAENEAVIQQALDRLARGRTTLILAHRLSSVIGADRILVLDHGKVVESGRHAELIRRDGPYRRLMGAQAEERGDDDVAFTEEALAAVAGSSESTDFGEEATVATAAAAAQVSAATTLATLIRVIAPWRRQFAIVVTSGIGRVAAFIGVGVVGALAVAAVKTGAPYGYLLILLGLLAPVAGGLHWIESWLAHDIAYRLLAEMRIDLYKKLDSLAPAYLVRRRSGDLIALASQDIETIEYFFAHTVAPALVAVLVPSAVLLTLAVVAWPIALVLLPFVLFAGLAPVLKRGRIDRLGAEAREALGLLGAYITETIQGLSDLVAFQAVGRRRDGFMDAVRGYQETRLTLLEDLSSQTAQLEMATGLGGLSVAVVGAILVSQHQLAATTLPVLILLSLAAFLPISEIAQVARQLADTIASTRRVYAVHHETPAVHDGVKRPPAPVGGSAIRFDGVGFAYPGARRPALSGVSLDIPAGATVAIVGPSGAGKTTLANLLLRFWDPTPGQIRIDGVDLRDFELDHLRHRISLVSQDTYLFNDTLRANVALARPDADEAAIRRALEQAALEEFVAGLPEGLDTNVGERGVQLSGGQRQRIAIARAFLKNAPTLILDEATSHLDAVSEAQVRNALDALMRDRTTIVIAHRLSTVRNADLLVVLDRGRLVELGSHAELVLRNGLYARLIRRQMGGAREQLRAVGD